MKTWNKTISLLCNDEQQIVANGIYDQWILGEKTSFYYANCNKGRDKGEVDIVWVDSATQKAFSLAEMQMLFDPFEELMCSFS